MWHEETSMPIFNLPRPTIRDRVSNIRWWLVASGALTLGLGIVIAVFAVRARHHGSTDARLLASDLTSAWQQSERWNITNYIYGSEYCSVEEPDTLVVRYPEGSYQNAGGFKFYAQPQGFPARSACFSYEVYFPPGFPWTKGGKLPGMYIGDWGANGGNHIDTGYSARFMWRANGTAEVYLYIPKGQHPGYYFNVITNYDYGESLWRGSLKLVDGQWNAMHMCITLNTSPQARDGILMASVNNVTMTYNKLVWTMDPAMPINGLMMNTFFGGNDPTWGAPTDTYAKFRGFSAP